MKTRLLIVLLLAISASAGVLGKKKKPEADTPSPLKQYITEATKNNSASQAARAPGAIWSSSAVYTNLGMDLKAKSVDDLVTIVVTEKASAVATGDVKTQRQSTDTTWTSRGAALDFRGAGGSRSWELIQAMPPRKRMMSAGIDHTIISMRPENSHSGR